MSVYISFVVPMLAFAALVVLPGTILLRGMRLPWQWAVCLSSLPAIGLYCILGQAYATLGIVANPILMAAPVIVLSLALYVAFGRKGEPTSLPHMSWWVPCFYVVVGLGLGVTLFVSRLTTPDLFEQSYDVTQHFNLIRAMADSGRFSSVNVGFYLTPADQAANPFPGGMFYPGTWHMLCAMVVQVTGVGVPLVINVSQYFFVSVIYPLGCAAFMTAVFEDDLETLVAGALVCLGFVSFPWAFLIWGPVYPNTAAFAAVPATAATFILLTADMPAAKDRISLAVAFLLSGVGIGLLHPSGVFTTAVVLIPYCVNRVWVVGKRRWGGTVRPLVASVGFVIFAFGVWYLCFTLPAFEDIVWHIWDKWTKTWQAIVNIATLSYSFGFNHGWYEFAAQLPLAAMVIIGAVWALHRSEYRWTVFSYLFACFICFIGATRDDDFRHLVAGFWYTDGIRIAGICVLAAYPLAALGLKWSYQLVLRVVRRYNGKHAETKVRKVAAVCMALFMLVNFLPEFDLPGSYFSVTLNPGLNKWPEEAAWKGASEIKQRALTRAYHSNHTPFGDYRVAFDKKMSQCNVLSPKETEFLYKVSALVDDDALVINDPLDGSFLAYGFSDLHVYYRNFVDNGWEEAEDSKLIRTSLADITTRQEVRDAVKRIGAEYVLLLSENNSDVSFINLRGDFNEEQFNYQGITAVSPDNPGFELVLRQDDLYLYRIVSE